MQLSCVWQVNIRKKYLQQEPFARNVFCMFPYQWVGESWNWSNNWEEGFQNPPWVQRAADGGGKCWLNCPTVPSLLTLPHHLLNAAGFAVCAPHPGTQWGHNRAAVLAESCCFTHVELCCKEGFTQLQCFSASNLSLLLKILRLVL